MARTAFKQADLTRAIKGALKAGATPKRAELSPDGKLVLYFETGADEQGTAYDRWREERGSRAS